MVPQVQRNLTSGLTGFCEVTPEQMSNLERDRWPEFARELMVRRLRKIHFDFCQWIGEQPCWGWMISRCRKWEEVERVLNKHNVEYRWKDRRSVLELDDAQIVRVS